jgi:sulfide:quinone oxidoreductase
MEIRKLNQHLSVAGQISAADVAIIASQGFKTILCNRPDGEDTDQPTFESIKHAAEISGLAVIFMPVFKSGVTGENIGDFAKIFENAEIPMLAYCRTGTRCTILWALSEGAKGTPVDQIIGLAADAGYDLSKMAGRLVDATSAVER